LPVGTANGNFGPSTRNCCPTIPYTGVETSYSNQAYSANKISDFTELLNFLLYVNGFGNGNFTSGYISTDVENFQELCALPENGVANLSTWMSLLVSYGDNTRPGTACDTRFEITNIALGLLQTFGFQYVGRYIVGGSFKEIREGELERIFDGGLSVFPIFQNSGTSSSYFTYVKGLEDGRDAQLAAVRHQIPENTIIYFAVDFDALDTDVTNKIIPYFQGVNDAVESYQIGIYGARNVCKRVASAGYSTSSFVSDMSSGFSGNLGYGLPLDWAFDQIANQTIGNSSGSLEIDKDISSGHDNGFNQFLQPKYVAPPSEDLSFGNNGIVYVNRSGTNIPVYETLVSDGIHVAGITAGGAIIGYIPSDGFYSSSPHSDSPYITSFGVITGDDNGNVIRGYIETSQGVTLGDYPWLSTQEAFYEYNSNGSILLNSLPTAENIHGESYRIFTAKKYLDCRTLEGDILPRIRPGTKLATRSSVSGEVRPFLMKFSFKKVSDT
jgi:peptidoglycan hydrolase-like protein with peptidoglycan-binding domain